MTSALSEGSTSAMTSSMPTSSATARAVVSLSPVSRTGRRPSAFSDATASADVALTVSATTKTAVACPSQPAAIAVCPRASAARRAASSAGGRCMRPIGQQRGPAHDQRVALDDALDAEPFAVGEALDRGQRARRRRGGGDGLGDRVLGGVLERADQAQRLVTVDAVGHRDLDEAHPAGGHGAGLVEDDGVDRAGWTPGPRGP